MAMNKNELEAYWRQQNEGVTDMSGPIGAGYGNSGYEKAILERSKKQEASAPITGTDRAAKGLASPQAAQAVEAAGQGDATGAIGNGMVATGVATANPYLLAGGLAVNVLAAGEQNKRANEEKQRLAYNERIAQRQQQMNAIGKIALQ